MGRKEGALFNLLNHQKQKCISYQNVCLVFGLVLCKTDPKSTSQSHCEVHQRSEWKAQHNRYFWRRIWNILSIQTDFSPCSTGVISLTSLGHTWMRESRYWEEKKASVNKGISGMFHSLQSLKQMFYKWILSFKHGFYTDQHSLTTPPKPSMNFPSGELGVCLTPAQRAPSCYPALLLSVQLKHKGKISLESECRLCLPGQSWLHEHCSPAINSSLRRLQLHHACRITRAGSPWWQCHALCKHQLARQGYFGNPSVTGNDPNLLHIYEKIIWIKNMPIFHSRADSVLLLLITGAISMSPELPPLEWQTIISRIII